MTTLLLLCNLKSMAMKKHSRIYTIETANSQKQTLKLLKNIRVLRTTDDRDRTEALWLDAEVIDALVSSKPNMILPCIVCPFKLADYQK